MKGIYLISPFVPLTYFYQGTVLSFLYLAVQVPHQLFYFEIQRALSDIPANLPGGFSLFGQGFFAVGSSNSEKAH